MRVEDCHWSLWVLSQTLFRTQMSSLIIYVETPCTVMAWIWFFTGCCHLMPSHLERQEMPSWGCDALLKMAAKAPGKIINPFLVLIQNGFRASGYSDRTKKNGSFLINVCLLRKYWHQVCITPFKKFLRGHRLQPGRASPTYLEGIAYKPGGHHLQTERASLVGLGECRGHLLRA